MISGLGKLTTDRQTGWGPRAERADVGGPLAVGGSERYTFLFNIQVYIIASSLIFLSQYVLGL